MNALFFDVPSSPPPKSPLPRAKLSLRLGDEADPAGTHKAIRNPTDIAFIGSDYFVVADSDGHRLLIFDVNGRLCNVIGDQHIWPNCIAVTRDEKIVVTDRKKALIKIYDVTGECLQAWGEEQPGGEDEIDYRPHGVAVNSRGQILVTDTTLNEVIVYSSSGQRLHALGRKGNTLTELSLPFYLTVDQRNDNIIISDNMNFAVKIFDAEGNFISKIGTGRDWGRRLFSCPYGVCVDRDHNVLIADHEKNKITMYTDSGTRIGDVVTPRDCISPCGVSVSPKGDLLYTESTDGYSNVKMCTLLDPNLTF